MEYNYYRLLDKPTNSLPKLTDEKKVIIFLSLQENNPSTHTFLTKMMGALGIDLKVSCQIINIDPNQNVDGVDLFRKELPLNLIFFGIEAKNIGLTTKWPPYRCFQLVNHKIILSEKISLIENDKARKLKLWNELKYMFKVVD